MRYAVEYFKCELYQFVNSFKANRTEAIEVLNDHAVLSLKEQIKERRKVLNLRQSDLAALSGLNQPGISRLESSSNKSMTLNTLQTIAASMGCIVVIDILPVKDVILELEAVDTKV
jgi:DNA-binding XRE family transcriptional regulator